MSELLDSDVSRWIVNNIHILNDKAKFRAINSIRFAHWANDFQDSSPPMSSFCTLHAIEEAVACFISAAKVCGHKDRAKTINIRDHKNKALVSILAARASSVAKQGSLAVAVHEDKQSLVYRLPNDGDYRYERLHLSSFHVDFDGTSTLDGMEFLGHTPLLEDIEAEVERVVNARNEVLYASDKGYPCGFLNVQKEVQRAANLSLGLIWGGIDIHLDPANGGRFIQMILDKMIEINQAR